MMCTYYNILSVCLHFINALFYLLSYVLCYVSNTVLQILTIFNCETRFNVMYYVDRVLYKCAIINKGCVLRLVAWCFLAISL